MTRVLVRTLLVAVMAVAVTVLAVPAADASPLDPSETGKKTGWLGTALAFFGTLLTGDEIGLVTLFMMGSDDGSGTRSTPPPRPNDFGPRDTTQSTGACIDPNGMPTICAY